VYERQLRVHDDNLWRPMQWKRLSVPPRGLGNLEARCFGLSLRFRSGS
jgi:hypothetical protein